MWIKTKALRARLPLAIALLLAWWLACWLVTGVWFHNEARESYRTESLLAEHFVAEASTSFNRVIKSRGGVQRVLARDPRIQRVLARYASSQALPQASEAERRLSWSADPELAQVSHMLKLTASDMGLDTVVLLDAKGYCLAASNADSAQSIVGAYSGDREDFQRARLGRTEFMASVGAKMGSTGLSFSVPVIDQGGSIGVLRGGIALAPFVNLFERAGSFLSDPHGVVMLARDPSFMLHTLPDEQVNRLDAAARQVLYQRTEFKPLNLTPAQDDRFPELVHVPGQEAPALLRSQSVADGGLSVNVLWPMPLLAELKQEHVLSASALGTIGTLLMVLAAVYASRRREQRTTALALAQREQLATQARNFLDQIVNAIADPLFVKDREHRWVLVNQAFCKIHGQPRENFIGKSAHDAFPEHIAQGIWDADERVLTAGIEIIAEEKLTDSQGVTHIVVTKKVPYTDVAGQCFIVGTISDISERKQVERLLRTRERESRSLAENLPDNVVRWDRQGRYVYVNPTNERSIGARSEDVFGKRLGEAFPDGRFNPLETAIDQIVASGQAIAFVRQPVTMENGEMRLHDIQLVPEFDDEGHVVTVLGIGRDLTDIYRMQETLAVREREFRNLAENNPDVIIRYDRECRRIYVNSALATMAGRTPDGLLGQLPENCTPLAEPERYLEALRHAMDEGKPRSLDVQVRRADGELGWYQASFVPEFDADGQVVGVLTVARDITERRRMEETLATREREFRSLAVHLPDNVSRWDLDGCYLYINPVHERTLGVSAQDMIGKAIPDSHTVVKAAIAQVVATGQAAMLVRQSVVVDGETQIHDVSLAPEHDAEGRIISVLGIGRDMTEIYRMQEALAAREREYRTLAETSPDSIYRYDRDYRRLYVNQAVCKIVGKSAEELIGSTIDDGKILVSEQGRKVMAHIDRVFDSGELQTFMVDFVDQNGEHHDYHMLMAPEHDADGSVATVFGFTRNVSDIKKLERRQSQYFAMAPGLFATIEHRADGSYAMPFASEGIRDLLGLEPQAVMKDISVLVAACHPDDVEMTFRKTEESERDLTFYHVEYRIIHPDKGVRWLEVRSMPRRLPDGGTRWDGFYHDISARKQAEDALRESEDKLRGLYELSPLGIALTDMNGGYLEFNEAFRAICAYPADELKTLDYWTLTPREYESQEAEQLESLSRTGRYGPYEKEYRQKDGKRIAIQLSGMLGTGKDGQKYIWSIVEDISVRKAVEDALRESRESLNEAQRIAHVGSWDVDMVNDKLIWSDEIYRMWEIDPAHFKADFAAFIETVHPQDRENVNRAFRESLVNHSLYEVEHRLLFPDGRVKYMLERGEPKYDAQGNPVRFIGTSLDITSRRRMEDELQRGRLALEDAQRIGQIGSWELDLVSGVLDWSDETCRMFEIDPAVFGASMDAFINVIHPEDRERVNAAYDASIKNRTAYDVEHRLLLPNGRIKDVRERGETWYDADGRPLRTLGTVQNITEAKLAEARLRKSRDIVRALAAHQETEHEKERRQLAYDIHEDLAQNLAALRLNISLFEISRESVPGAPLLKTISAIADRSIVRIRDIVSVLRTTVLDLGLVPALHWLTDDFKGVGFQFDLALPEDILLNDEVSTFLFRAAREALLNVALHAAATHIHVSLNTVAGVCRLAVRDNGCGFDPAAPQREGSFGLIGLTEQARHLGGDLSIDSTPDQGTALEIRVPGLTGDILP